MSRLCTNCRENHVDESKQTFYYRDWEGNKWDASFLPVCDACINAGEYRNEFYSKDTVARRLLHLGSSRVYKDNGWDGLPWFCIEDE